MSTLFITAIVAFTVGYFLCWVVAMFDEPEPDSVHSERIANWLNGPVTKLNDKIEALEKENRDLRVEIDRMKRNVA